MRGFVEVPRLPKSANMVAAEANGRLKSITNATGVRWIAGELE